MEDVSAVGEKRKYSSNEKQVKKKKKNVLNVCFAVSVVTAKMERQAGEDPFVEWYARPSYDALTSFFFLFIFLSI